MYQSHGCSLSDRSHKARTDSVNCDASLRCPTRINAVADQFNSRIKPLSSCVGLSSSREMSLYACVQKAAMASYLVSSCCCLRNDSVAREKLLIPTNRSEREEPE